MGKSGPLSPRISIHFLGWGMVLLAVMTWTAVAGYWDFREARSKKTHLEAMVKQVTQLDKFLTAYSRSAVTFGDMRSEGYYLESTLQRERVMAQLSALSPKIFAGSEALAMNTAKAEVTGLENKAFDYVRAEKLKLADPLLFSEAYDDKNQEYVRDFNNFTMKLQDEFTSGYEQQRNKMLGMAGLGVVLLPFFAFVHFALVNKLKQFYLEYGRPLAKV